MSWINECGALLAATGIPLTAALFLAGLGGSLTHCSAMCSTFVLGQTSALAQKVSIAHLLLPYHAGRLTTYSAIGAAVGFSFHLVSASPVFVVARHLLLALVAVTFLVVFSERILARFGIRLPAIRSFTPRCVLGAINGIRSVRGTAARFGLGAALGFLPCPMVFAALMAVAAKADPVAGAAGMAAFALGTMPILMGIGTAGAGFLSSSPRARQVIGLAAFGVNGVVLLALALS